MEVTILPVDGGFIVAWNDLKKHEVPLRALSHQESWQNEKRTVLVAHVKQAVRENLGDALQLVEKIIKRNVERLNKGDQEGDIVDPLELAP